MQMDPVNLIHFQRECKLNKVTLVKRSVHTGLNNLLQFILMNFSEQTNLYHNFSRVRLELV